MRYRDRGAALALAAGSAGAEGLRPDVACVEDGGCRHLGQERGPDDYFLRPWPWRSFVRATLCTLPHQRVAKVAIRRPTA